MKHSPARHSIRFHGVLALWLSTVGLWIVSPAAALAETPACQKNSHVTAEQFVYGMYNEADAIVKDKDAPLARLKTHLANNMAFDAMAKFVLGGFWNDATAGQRVEFRRLFSRTLRYSVATQLLQYRGSKFEILGHHASGANSMLVTTKVNQPRGGSSLIDWRIGFERCRFLAVDLLQNGVSLITTKREEFNAVIRRRGIDGLLSSLNSQARAQDEAELLGDLFLQAAGKLRRRDGEFSQSPTIFSSFPDIFLSF